MALQSFTLTIGAAKDSDNNDKNYVSGQTIYIKKTNGTLASIYRDLAGTSQIAQDGLSNVTNSNGQFTFFVEAGDYNAEYQSQVTPITVVGADYFNNRIDETVNQVILDLSTSRGFRVQGSFAAGFTYELPNDVGLDASGNAWIYTDVEALPFTVPAATTPSFPTYTQVTFNSASGVIDSQGTNVQNYINKNLSSFNSLADAVAYDYSEIPSGVKINRLGYYSASDGGSNWGVLKKGDSTPLVDDGGSISVIVNDAVNGVWIEWNFTGKPRVSILKFGARPSNTALDNNSRINRAMDVAEANSTVIFVPKGRFETGQHLGRSNSGIVGVGRESVLIRNRGLSDFGVTLFIAGGSSNPDDNIKNYKIRDVTFEGDVVASGFSEFKHLIMIQGGSNINLKRVYFKGFEGDGLVIRSGNNAYQNDTIRVSACEFDGVNNDNRNGISINDCVGLYITSCKFINCTRSNQPGAIDIEPNTQDTYVRLRNIRIRDNEFINIGGNVGCIAMFLPIPWQDFTNGYPYDIEVSGNNMRNVFRAFHFTNIQNADIDETAPDINLKILNNTAQTMTDRPFWVYGLKGVRLEGNFYRDAENASRIGWSEVNRGTVDVTLRKEKFRLCGKTDGGVINIYNSIDTTIERVAFEECGRESGGFGIPIQIVGTASRVKLIRNNIVNEQSLTTAAVSVTGTLTPGGNESFDNDWAGLGASSFVPDLTQFGESTIDASVTASSTLGQANATQLDDSVNIITTSNSTNSGVKLPAANRLGRFVTVVNRGAAPAAVYPLEGDNLGQGINVFEQLAVGGIVTYKSYDSVNWVKISSS